MSFAQAKKTHSTRARTCNNLRSYNFLRKNLIHQSSFNLHSYPLCVPAIYKGGLQGNEGFLTGSCNKEEFQHDGDDGGLRKRDKGYPKGLSWVQTRWCVGKIPASPLSMSLTWGCQWLITSRVCCCALKRKYLFGRMNNAWTNPNIICAYTRYGRQYKSTV